MRSNVTLQEADVWDVASPDVPLIHCVSADFALGAGFAKDVSERYPAIRRMLQRTTASIAPVERVGCAFRYDAPDGQVIYNLITKTYYWMRGGRDQQPNTSTLARALRDAHNQALAEGHLLLTMPQIASGLDRLPWDKTLSLLERVFPEGEGSRVIVCLR